MRARRGEPEGGSAGTNLNRAQGGRWCRCRGSRRRSPRPAVSSTRCRRVRLQDLGQCLAGGVSAGAGLAALRPSLEAALSR